MKSVRNTSFSQTGIGPRSAASCHPPAWCRIRRAVDGYAAAIVRIIGESYGKETVQTAWREFTVGDRGPFLGDDPNAELFFSWLFHRWSPELEESHKIDNDSCYGVPPTRAYLSRNASGLVPLQRRYLEACLEARFSFYEILDCEPHIGFKARDVLEGKDTYIPTWSGFLYLAMVLDVYSRRVVGWAMETHLKTELILSALEMA
jgi:transposase InsO family protein